MPLSWSNLYISPAFPKIHSEIKLGQLRTRNLISTVCDMSPFRLWHVTINLFALKRNNTVKFFLFYGSFTNCEAVFKDLTHISQFPLPGKLPEVITSNSWFKKQWDLRGTSFQLKMNKLQDVIYSRGNIVNIIVTSCSDGWLPDLSG